MRLIHLLIIGVLVLAAGLLVHAPAAVLYGWTLGARNDEPLRLHGIDGELFAGKAAQVSYANRAVASDLRWTLRPGALALGRAAFHVRSSGAPLLFDGVVAAGLGGTRITGLKASGDLRTLAALAGQSFVPVSGQAGLDLDHLLLKDQWPQAAEGRVQVLGLSWALGQPVVLGDFQAELRSEDGNVQAAITTLSGVVDVLGDARLNNDRSYAVDLRLRPRADAPPMVRNLLQALGPADAEGYHRLRQGAAGLPAPASERFPVPAAAPQPPPATSPTTPPVERHHMMPAT